MFFNTFIVQTIYGSAIFTSSKSTNPELAGAIRFLNEKAARRAAKSFLQQEHTAGLMAFLHSKAVL
jgi:hypothetical protein